MLRVAETHDEVRVVNDQIGTPTYTFDLARLPVDMIETDKYGYYHATNEGGYISWYDFCYEINIPGDGSAVFCNCKYQGTQTISQVLIKVY